MSSPLNKINIKSNMKVWMTHIGNLHKIVYVSMSVWIGLAFLTKKIKVVVGMHLLSHRFIISSCKESCYSSADNLLSFHFHLKSFNRKTKIGFVSCTINACFIIFIKVKCLFSQPLCMCLSLFPWQLRHHTSGKTISL